jgi:hypothetical protein
MINTLELVSTDMDINDLQVVKKQAVFVCFSAVLTLRWPYSEQAFTVLRLHEGLTRKWRALCYLFEPLFLQPEP